MLRTPALAIGLTAVLVAGTGTAVAGHAAFTDGPFGVHEAGIHYVADAGITTGCSADRYCPDIPVTRAQMATFLHRMAGQVLAGTVLLVEGEIADGAGFAACPAGSYASGGGFVQDGRSIPVVDVALYDEESGEDLWVVGLEDPATGTLSGTGVVQANCVFPADLLVDDVSAMSAPDAEPGRAAALVERARAR